MQRCLGRREEKYLKKSSQLSSSFIKIINPQIREAKRISSKRTAKNTATRCIIIKRLKEQDLESGQRKDSVLQSDTDEDGRALRPQPDGRRHLPGARGRNLKARRPTALYPVRVSTSNAGETHPFSDIRKLEGFVTGRPVLQEIFK